MIDSDYLSKFSGNIDPNRNNLDVNRTNETIAEESSSQNRDSEAHGTSYFRSAAHTNNDVSRSSSKMSKMTLGLLDST